MHLPINLHRVTSELSAGMRQQLGVRHQHGVCESEVQGPVSRQLRLQRRLQGRQPRAHLLVSV